MSLATVHLVRHGEVHNPERVLYGRLPNFHLSELGREMAQRVAGHFAGRANAGASIVQLVASPLTRAQETAAPIAQRLGLEIVTDARVIEAYSRFEGMSQVVRQLRHPRYWPLLINPLRPSWGEPYGQQVGRMMAAVTDARVQAVGLAEANGSAGPAEVIVVGHQLPIWVSRLAAENRRLWHDPRDRECTLTSITSLDFDGERLVGVRYEEPSADLLPGAANLPGA
ncbi:histidine phosphatase family protein [Arthrobacter sp. H20]|uniref:histidine phosphatase family protein n=1 Tax=Arthrobacter sp. H20 TaxID=1267981 RepID=UPI00047E17E5|nr:histidine phosphatase family protein [Arthrobacter sp. H20]